MRRNFNLLLVVVVIIALGCSSAPKVDKDLGDANAVLISAQNRQLANSSFSGFGYKSSKLPSHKWDRWAKSAAPVVKEILQKIPDGYTLQVTGHADASGPEEPVGNKPGNIKISTDRAETVYNALRRAGIDSPKMTYKGLGSSEIREDIDPRADEQRRVTFKVLPVE